MKISLLNLDDIRCVSGNKFWDHLLIRPIHIFHVHFNPWVFFSNPGISALKESAASFQEATVIVTGW